MRQPTGEHAGFVAQIEQLGVGGLLQSLPRLGQEPRIPHRNDRLRREVLQQCDLLFRKSPDLLAIDAEEALRNAIFAQRHPNRGAGITQLDHSNEPRGPKFGTQSGDIRNLDGVFAAPQTIGHAPWMDSDGQTDKLGQSNRNTMGRDYSIMCLLVGCKDAKSGSAQAHRLFEHRVEHGHKIAGRGVDDLQYLGGRGLLLQRLITFGFEFVALCRQLGQLALKITDGLLEMGQCAIWRRAHLRPR
jgi:hypothetical protein